MNSMLKQYMNHFTYQSNLQDKLPLCSVNMLDPGDRESLAFLGLVLMDFVVKDAIGAVRSLVC